MSDAPSSEKPLTLAETYAAAVEKNDWLKYVTSYSLGSKLPPKLQFPILNPYALNSPASPGAPAMSTPIELIASADPNPASWPYPTWKRTQGKALMLRTTKEVDGRILAWGNFEWPREPGAIVACENWDPRPSCGGGLHGLLWGEGTIQFLDWSENPDGSKPAVVWQVVEVEENLVVQAAGKAKVPYCRLVYTGDRETACAIVSRYSPKHVELTRKLEEQLTTLPHPTYSWHGKPENYKSEDTDRRWAVPMGPLATLVSSEITGEEDSHSVLLDLDVPAKLVQSSTPGHSHLAIDVKLPWRRYRRLLEMLEDCGIIEEGYLKASLDRRATFLRLPWVRK